MKRTTTLAACLVLATSGALLAGTCQSNRIHRQSTQHVGTQSNQKDIVDTAAEAGSFNTLIAAAKAAGLVDALKGRGPLTVFAPTDDAFKKLPEGTVESLLKPESKQTLQAILLYHVVPGKLTADKVARLSAAQSKQGEMVRFQVNGENVLVGGATVVNANIECSNGVIHVIDSVIMPPSLQQNQQQQQAAAKPAPQPTTAAKPVSSDIVETAQAAGSFNTLIAAAKAAGLVETLKGEGPLTVFAPTDEAFAKLPEGTVENLLKPENKEQLAGILTYHVVAGKVMAKDVVGLESAETVNGKSAPISASNGGVQIDGANVIKTDIECSNGVIHVIDAVILP